MSVDVLTQLRERLAVLSDQAVEIRVEILKNSDDFDLYHDMHNATSCLEDALFRLGQLLEESRA